jgi:hypothetical protein
MSEAKTPQKLNDEAIYIAGLAETLQCMLEASISEDGNELEGALNLSFSFMALSELAKTLSERIGDNFT